MAKILIPSAGTDSWRAFLADPEKQWRTGYSAKALAYCWEEADGFPESVRRALEDSEVKELHGLEMLLGIPEHQVPLPGGSRPSQNDLWVLARGSDGLVSIAVEGKVSEPFGPTVGEWMRDASPGKKRRLDFLLAKLSLAEVPPDVRYQLLHRTVSAILEAERFGAKHAVMLVHSFSQTHEWLDDYRRFAGLFDADGSVGQVSRAGASSDPKTYLGWVAGEARFLAS